MHVVAIVVLAAEIAGTIAAFSGGEDPPPARAAAAQSLWWCEAAQISPAPCPLLLRDLSPD